MKNTFAQLNELEQKMIATQIAERLVKDMKSLVKKLDRGKMDASTFLDQMGSDLTLYSQWTASYLVQLEGGNDE